MKALRWLGFLPQWFLSIAAFLVALVLLLIGGYRGKVVRSNLNLVFPNRSRMNRAWIYTRFQFHFAQLLVESAKLFSASKEDVECGVVHENTEIFEKLYRKGKHVLVAGGHFNNWEWSALTFAQFMPHRSMGLYKRLSDAKSEGMLRESRERFGLELVRTTEGRAWMNVARHGEPVAVIMGFDQSPADPTKCWWTTFLGTETAVFYGLEQWSKLYDMAVVFGKIRRVAPWKYKVTYELLAESASELAEGEVLDRCLAQLESQIMEEPERWLWSHKRWKHQRPESQPLHPRRHAPPLP